ncbi:hypothetical protein JCM14036_24350 [Desulfotomaculum defluvii]
MIKRLICLGLGSAIALFVLGLCLGGGGPIGFGEGTGTYFSSLQVFAQPNQQAIGPETTIREENIFICGDIEEVARKKAHTLQITDEKDLKNHYAAQGYSINQSGKQIIAQRKVDDFCSYHRKYRHLGIQDDKVAIFQGPIGYNQKLLRIEERLPVATLTADLQVKLQQSMDFFQMTPETQAVLRYEFEFHDEDALNAILENLDELQEE